jgi:hypothetical protein
MIVSYNAGNVKADYTSTYVAFACLILILYFYTLKIPRAKKYFSYTCTYV